MTLAQGDDSVVGIVLPFQQVNRVKNAFRQSDPKGAVSGAVPGMRLSDSDDERLWHVILAGTPLTCYEILQAPLVVCFDNEVVCVDNEVVTAPVI